ncbi:MAG TPA: hypothetical protein K8V35_08855 [Aliicoccus persicus]|uniref:Uncharacterized protein n=1 Tax=Aliicoccus persicus TaxID=930138 RepID=A0A921DY99_9STAP|nr:hypothetical protein [Aliicoccus persicus]
MNKRLRQYILPVLYLAFLLIMFLFFEEQVTWTLFIVATSIYIVLEIIFAFLWSRGNNDRDDHHYK